MVYLFLYRKEIRKFSEKAHELAWLRISALFVALRDPHTVFVPSCTSNFYFLLPYAFTVVANDDGTYYVKAIASHSYNITNYWIDTLGNTNLIGRKITYMTNSAGEYEDALTVISDWADAEEYISKYQHARFNRAINSDFHARVASRHKYSGDTLGVKYIDDDGEEQQ